jgi:hypothetical protein
MKRKKVKLASNLDLLRVLEKKKNNHTLTRVNFLRSLVLTKFYFFSIFEVKIVCQSP